MNWLISLHNRGVTDEGGVNRTNRFSWGGEASNEHPLNMAIAEEN
jgi:hypothetical protein